MFPAGAGHLKVSAQRFAKELNKASAGQARKHVFSIDEGHERWLEKHLAAKSCANEAAHGSVMRRKPAAEEMYPSSCAPRSASRVGRCGGARTIPGARMEAYVTPTLRAVDLGDVACRRPALVV